MTPAAVEVTDLGKKFRLYRERNQSLKGVVSRARRARYDELWAVRGVSLSIATGTTYGLIGDNGSGKSTLLKCLARILVPDEGVATARGRTAALLELGSGFHPDLTGRQNIFLNGAILGLSRRTVQRQLDDVVAFAGIEDVVDQPVKIYSSGMYARLGFAVASSLEPDVLLLDEVLAVGDAAFQRRCAERIGRFRDEGRTVVMVNHSSESVRRLCSRVAWLDGGRLVAEGPTEEVLDRYLMAGIAERPGFAGNGHRWGSGEVVVEAVELLADGVAATVLTAGEHVGVRVTIAPAASAVASPVVGLGIWALDGTHLWGSNTALEGVAVGVLAEPRDVVFDIPVLPLQPGVYELEVAVVDQHLAHTYDHHRRALRFDVAAGRHHESGGYVSLGGTFSVRKARDS